MTVTALELERIAARGWRAEHTQWLGDWLLRASGGFTMRANSVLPLGDPGLPLDDAIAHVTAFYDRHGLPPRVAIPSPARDDLRAGLEARGWTVVSSAQVLTAPLATILPPSPSTVAVEPGPSPRWVAAYRSRGGHDLGAAGRRLLVRGDVLGFAKVEDGAEVVAIGRGSVDDGWLGITAVDVAPSHRRRGLATEVMRALAGWARRHGATDAYLQVHPGNLAAMGLYTRAGFVAHHAYHHVQAPPV